MPLHPSVSSALTHPPQPHFSVHLGGSLSTTQVMHPSNAPHKYELHPPPNDNSNSGGLKEVEHRAQGEIET